MWYFGQTKADPTEVAQQICDGLGRYYRNQHHPYDQLFYKFCENEGYFDEDDLFNDELQEAIEDNNLIDFYKGDDQNRAFPFDKEYQTEFEKRKFIYDLIIKSKNRTSELRDKKMTEQNKQSYPSSIGFMKDNEIVHGYVRIYSKLNINLIPLEVINLCYVYYHLLVDSFKHYNPRDYRLSKEDLVVTKLSGSWQGKSVVYGEIAIPSLDETIHQWTFKIHQIAPDLCRPIGIGIDETKYTRRVDGTFPFDRDKGGESKLYYQWFYSGQEVKMELDLRSKNKTLSYYGRVPNGEWFDKSLKFQVDIGPNITYCMAVSCGYYNDMIELVSYASL